MDLYTTTSYRLSRMLTLRYSTSFSKSSALFSPSIRPHIFAIYGLVRIADEIVDTYKKEDSRRLLDALETETTRTIHTGYSTNPIVHAYADTARKFQFDPKLLKAFFESMRMDLAPVNFTQSQYETYIYGSAEVIGLLCLKVFVDGNQTRYEHLKPGARALGAAYQKVNFLRDIASDYRERQRVYFPGVSFDTFSEAEKKTIEQDIAQDFAAAESAVAQLPKEARRAVHLSFRYYKELLRVIEKTSIETLKSTRIRVPNSKKFLIRVSPRGIK